MKRLFTVLYRYRGEFFYLQIQMQSNISSHVLTVRLYEALKQFQRGASLMWWDFAEGEFDFDPDPYASDPVYGKGKNT